MKWIWIALVAGLVAAGSVVLCRRMFFPAPVNATEFYAAQTAERQPADHSIFDSLLKKYVGGARVDYRGLKTEQAALQRYLKSLETLDAKAYSRNELLALFVNTYNAATLELVLENYPAIASIKNIPASKRWDDKRWAVCGEPLSLSELEHDVLRTRFVEARVHFAINCASISCPPLRNEAYTGEKIDAQLQAQALTMNREFGGAQWDAAAQTLRLSTIYEWYRGDFTRSMELKDYVAQFAAPEVAAELRKRAHVEIVFQEYNWALNDIQR